MTLDDLKQRLPEHAKDVKLNLGSLARAEHLTERQRLGSLAAAALAARCPELLAAVEGEGKLSPEDLAAVRSIATTMSMNAVYYRFVHLVGGDDYESLPARLRMQALGHPPDDRADRELWALAVAAVHGCGRCLEAHEKTLRESGVSPETIHDAVRVAAIAHSVAVALDSVPTPAA